ncbi:hypothetical protein L7F22_015002 [Adiantum nelumboides]|nr:hypothetical protein [Adiantum nelumboides]
MESARTISVLLEKQQVSVLAERITALLGEVSKRFGEDNLLEGTVTTGSSDNDPLAVPLEEEFRVGTMGLGWDADSSSIVVELLAEATAWSVFYILVAIAFGRTSVRDDPRLGFRHPVLHGLHRREEPLGRQPVRLRRDHDDVRGAGGAPAKVLTFGIVLALIMRAIFIAVGATLLNLFSFMFLVFGLLLLWTAVQLYRHKDEDPDIEDNMVVKGARRLFPVTEEYDGGKLFTRDNGRRVATPMFIVLVSIGGIDLLFALDSIPAVFGVTQEPFIVFTANAFALLGLRALFFLVKGLLTASCTSRPAWRSSWASSG